MRPRAAGADRRGAPQPRPRQSAFRLFRSGGAIWPRERRRWRCCWRESRATGKPARARLRRVRCKAECLLCSTRRGANREPPAVADAGPTWPPGRSASCGWGPRLACGVGELHPSLVAALDGRPVRSPPSCTRCVPVARSSAVAPAFAPPALQAITRDFAFFVPAELSATPWSGRLRGRQAAISGARLFDRFESADGLSRP